MVLDYEKLSWSGSHYYAFVLTPDRNTVQLIDLGPAEPIEASAVRWRVRAQFTVFQEKLAECETREEALALEKSQEKTFRAFSARLHKKVLAPLQNALGNAKLLYIAADGELNLPAVFRPRRRGRQVPHRNAAMCLPVERSRPVASKPARAAQGNSGRVCRSRFQRRTHGGTSGAGGEGVEEGNEPGRVSRPNLRCSKGWAPLPGAAAEAKSIRAGSCTRAHSVP